MLFSQAAEYTQGADILMALRVLAVVKSPEVCILQAPEVLAVCSPEAVVPLAAVPLAVVPLAVVSLAVVPLAPGVAE